VVYVLKGVWILWNGRSPFINRPGSPNYSIITLQLRLSYMTRGAHAENIGL
jgi:hypothetical protein